MWLKRKSKEEKIIEEMKKKKEQVDKLKEEINKMGKLVLKDGKLTKVEDAPKVSENKNDILQDLPPIAPIPSNLISDVEDDEMFQREISRQQIAMPKPQAPVSNLNIEEARILDEYRKQKQMQEQIKYEQEYARQQEYIRQQNELAQQEAFRQTQFQQPNVSNLHKKSETVAITIELVNGTVLAIDVDTEQLNSFITTLNEAIDGQSSFPLGNKVINGRNVVVYTFE